jgi:hypothetical protein
MLANGVHIKVASERLGHSTTGITMDLYQHMMPGMQEDACSSSLSELPQRTRLRAISLLSTHSFSPISCSLYRC